MEETRRYGAMDPHKKEANLLALGLPDDFVNFILSANNKAQVIILVKTDPEGKRILQIDTYMDPNAAWYEDDERPDRDMEVEVSFADLKLIVLALNQTDLLDGVRLANLDEEDMDGMAMADKCLESLQACLPTIESFEYVNIMYVEYREWSCLLRVLQGLPKLTGITKLKVCEVEHVDKQCLVEIPSKMPHLRELEFKSCTMEHDFNTEVGGQDPMSEELTRTRKLMGEMVTNLPLLEKLAWISSGFYFQQETMDALKEAVLSQPNLKNLKLFDAGFDDEEEKKAFLYHITANRVKPLLPVGLATAWEEFKDNQDVRPVKHEDDGGKMLEQAFDALVAARFHVPILYELLHAIDPAMYALVAAESFSHNGRVQRRNQWYLDTDEGYQARGEELLHNKKERLDLDSIFDTFS